MNQNVQFEERQRFEKQSFEHQNDEQTKNALRNQSRQRAQARLEMIDELHSVFATLSRVVYEISHPEVLQMVEDESYQNILNSRSQRKAVDVCSCVTISGKVSVTSTTEASTLLR